MKGHSDTHCVNELRPYSAISADVTEMTYGRLSLQQESLANAKVSAQQD